VKRSPIERKTELKRTTRLKPASDKQRRKVELAKVQVEVEGKAFFDQIKGERCVVCGKTAAEAREAGTRHQAHHAISQERLKKLGLHRFLWDKRDAVCVCEEPCHRRHTSAMRRIKREELPSRVEEFVRELGLEHLLEREYGERYVELNDA
jgi:hypothetical protein